MECPGSRQGFSVFDCCVSPDECPRSGAGECLMLPLLDAQVRLLLLNHVAVRLAEATPTDLHAAGIENEQLARLRQLSALDLNRLAAMRDLTIGVAFDAVGLNAGLRAVALVNEAKTLEAYFIRNGASWKMMSALFKIRRKVTLKRRRDCGAWRPSGRLQLPDYPVRERIFRAWLAIDDPSPRVRYYRLHQAFPQFSIAVLEAVAHEFEADQ